MVVRSFPDDQMSELRRRVAELERERLALSQRLDHAEREQRELQYRLLRARRLLDTVPDLVACFGADGLVSYVNDAWCRFFGRERDEVLGQSLLALIPPDRRDAVRGRMERARREHSVERYDLPAPTDDGEPRWIEWTLQPVEDTEGRVAEFVAIGRDITQRRAAEEALRENELRYRTALESTLDAVWDYDFVADRFWVSENFDRLFGRTTPLGMERTFEHWLARIDDESQAGVREGIARVLAERKPHWSGEYRLQKPDGTWAVVEAHATIDYATDGRPLRAIGSLADITERRAAEDALRESEARYAAVFQGSGSPMVLIDPGDGSVVDYNPAAQRFYGYGAEAMLQLRGADINPAPAAELDARLERLRAGQERVFQARHRLHSGELRDVEVYTGLVTLRGRELVFCIIHDITDRVRAERELRESEERYRELFDSATIGIYLLTDRFINCNEQGARIFGMAREEVIGRTPAELSPPQQLDGRSSEEAARAYIGAALAGTPQRFEWQHLRGDGEEATIEVTLKAVRLNGETVLLVTHHDITERKQAEALREELELRLRQAQKMEAIGQLAGGVAHDFNNILTTIHGYGEMLRDSLDGDPRRADADEVLAAAERGADLTRQLLAFSRREAIRPELLDVRDVVEPMQNMLHRLIGEHITLETHLAPGLGRVKADPGQLAQVVMNLLVNARDAMPDGGRLSVRTYRASSPGPQTEPAPTARPYVVIEVQDTGHGMDAATRERIFEPFFTTKEMGKGTGLGLATVYGVVQQNDGYIEVDSRPGEGSTFSVYLPCHDCAAPTSAARGGETILLVEDEQSLRELLARVLSGIGYEVLTAADGAEARILLDERADDLDLVVTDVVLPDTDGRQVADAVARRRSEIPIIFMSGYAEAIITDHGVIRPGLHFVPKPFAPAELATRIRSVLDGGDSGAVSG